MPPILGPWGLLSSPLRAGPKELPKAFGDQVFLKEPNDARLPVEQEGFQGGKDPPSHRSLCLSRTELSQKERGAFPRRVRAAGIVAESKDEAVYALTEGTERLMTCVENQLTANLFLMSECPPPEAQLLGHPPPSRRRRMSGKVAEEYGEPEGPEAGRVRWLGLFGHSGRKEPKARGKTILRLCGSVASLQPPPNMSSWGDLWPLRPAVCGYAPAMSEGCGGTPEILVGSVPGS